MKEIQVLATVENIDTVTDFVNEQLEEIGCPMKIQMQMDVAIDEIFSNIAHYAYHPEEGPAQLQVEMIETEEGKTGVCLTFIDHGKPYDPLAKEDPDVTKTAEERDIGGLGIFLVKKTMDEINYEYRDGKNILTIKKHI